MRSSAQGAGLLSLLRAAPDAVVAALSSHLGPAGVRALRLTCKAAKAAVVVHLGRLDVYSLAQAQMLSTSQLRPIELHMHVPTADLPAVCACLAQPSASAPLSAVTALFGDTCDGLLAVAARHMGALRALDCMKGEVSDWGVLAALPSLQTLYIGEESAAFLAALPGCAPRLRSLCLGEPPRGPCPGLGGLSRLQHLHCWGPCEHLVPVLPQLAALTRLNLEGGLSCLGDLAVALAHLPLLRELTLEDMPHIPAGSGALSSLTRLRINGTMDPRGFQAPLLHTLVFEYPPSLPAGLPNILAPRVVSVTGPSLPVAHPLPLSLEPSLPSTPHVSF